MKRMRALLLALIAAWAAASVAAALAADSKFEHLAVRVEQNATDGDFEIVFEATGGDTGLASLKVTAPDGRTVLEFAAPNSKLGIRTIRLETPEPKTLASLQADFPAGAYTFRASTVAGAFFSGSASLSHKLPGVATVIRPRSGEANVPISGLQMKWAAPNNLSSCLVAIEHDESGVKVAQAVLAGGARAYHVPDGVLLPGTRYKVSIGTVVVEGNASFVETAFTTAKK